jgi:hypothetical protein
MLHSFRSNIQGRKGYLALAGWVDRPTEPCLARVRAALKPAQMWAEIHHRRYAVDSFDRQLILSSSIHDFSATYIDHTLASALLFRWRSPQVGDSVAQIHRLREREEQEGANHERDFSKTD